MIRTLIYGSCVSRDTFDYAPKGDFQLLTYIARQSLASAFSQRPTTISPGTLASPFQTRMVAGDWKSSLERQLVGARARIDLILWDLCDERLGFFDLGDGEVVTQSVDLISSGLSERLSHRGRLIPFGTPEHEQAFDTALQRFRQLLEDLQLRDKLVLVAPPWAGLDEQGKGGLQSFGRTAEQANEMFAIYTRTVVERFGCPVVGTAIRPTASSTHQWGRAPFHYSDYVYEALVREISHALHDSPEGQESNE